MQKGFLMSTLIPMIAGLTMVIAAGAPIAAAQTDAPPALKQLGESFVQVAEKVTPSVVNINSSKKGLSGPMGGDVEQFFKNHPFREFLPDELFKRFKRDEGRERGFRAVGAMCKSAEARRDWPFPTGDSIYGHRCQRHRRKRKAHTWRTKKRVVKRRKANLGRGQTARSSGIGASSRSTN